MAAVGTGVCLQSGARQSSPSRGCNYPHGNTTAALFQTAWPGSAGGTAASNCTLYPACALRAKRSRRESASAAERWIFLFKHPQLFSPHRLGCRRRGAQAQGCDGAGLGMWAQWSWAHGVGHRGAGCGGTGPCRRAQEHGTAAGTRLSRRRLQGHRYQGAGTRVPRRRDAPPAASGRAPLPRALPLPGQAEPCPPARPLPAAPSPPPLRRHLPGCTPPLRPRRDPPSAPAAAASPAG